MKRTVALGIGLSLIWLSGCGAQDGSSGIPSESPASIAPRAPGLSRKGSALARDWRTISYSLLGMSCQDFATAHTKPSCEGITDGRN